MAAWKILPFDRQVENLPHGKNLPYRNYVRTPMRRLCRYAAGGGSNFGPAGASASSALEAVLAVDSE